MCLQNEELCSIPTMTGYVVVIKEEENNETIYKGVYRNYFTVKQGERTKAIMFGESIGGFYAFKTLKDAITEYNTWKNEEEHAIVECLLEDVFAQGIFSLFPTKKKVNTSNKKAEKKSSDPLAVRAKYRTIIKEIDIEEWRKEQKQKKKKRKLEN